jgi:hypothetical protein
MAEVSAAAASLGASERQRAWVTAVHGACTPRPINHTPITLRLTRQALSPGLTIAYAELPAEVVLAVLQGMVPDVDHGVVLGTVQGALGAGDAVHRLEVSLHPGDRPALAFASRPVA